MTSNLRQSTSKLSQHG